MMTKVVTITGALAIAGLLACSVASALPVQLPQHWSEEALRAEYEEVMRDFSVKELPPAEGGLIAGIQLDLTQVGELSKVLTGGVIPPKLPPESSDTYRLGGSTALFNGGPAAGASPRDAIVKYTYNLIGGDRPQVLSVQIQVAQRSRRDALARFLALADSDSQGYDVVRPVKQGRRLGELAGRKVRVDPQDTGKAKKLVTDVLLLRNNVVVRVELRAVGVMEDLGVDPSGWVMAIAEHLDAKLTEATKYRLLSDSGRLPVISRVALEVDPGEVYLASVYPIEITANDPLGQLVEVHFQMPVSVGGSTITRATDSSEWSLATGHKEETIDAQCVVVSSAGLVAVRSLSVTVRERPVAAGGGR